ncbi:Methyltransferase domain-containing protein [Luteibacter sp. 329MFSha]|nr:Methyltransferase domain-containing protein [Luteibacter sp. 329MFSha]
MRVLELNGSDLDNFECPRCGANDRLRHLLMYLDSRRFFERFAGARVLHFAPERALVSRIDAAGPSTYVLADIEPSSDRMVRVDMTRMQFGDGSFDVVIANHVLEHVHDLGAALHEVGRVLAPGGHAILQTPYSRRLSATFEDRGIDTDTARHVMYGQEDHVRLFGANIVEEIARLSGLVATGRPHHEELPDVDAWRNGVNAAEPFFLFRRT